MTNQSQRPLGKGKLIDDVGFDEQDASEFESYLYSQDENEQQIPDMQPGSILKGRIVEFTKDHVIVDVNLKSEGMIPISDFSDPSELVLDAEIEVYLEATENADGQIVLSREKAERQRQWEYILEHCEEGSIVKGRVTRKVKGGLMVDIGMEAFLPGSQIDNKRIKNLDDYLGRTYEFKILKINIERKNVVVSRRELIEAERVSKKAALLEAIQVGDKREGVVKNITDFGVFLDLDGIDGLLHITDMTWKRIKHPSEMVQIGDKLRVVVLNVDRDKGRIALGLKQMTPNPWEEIEKKYPVGSRVEGRIVNLLPYGAFIEIEPGIEGLIHVSEMSWVRNITDPSELLARGDEVKAVVLSVQKEEGKISLGLKQNERNPWEDVGGKYHPGDQLTVEVKNLTNYGAFVELEPGVEGLIHISDLSWVKRVSHPSEVLKKGERVHAIILTADLDNKKITLGIKQLSEDPWRSIDEKLPVGSLVTGTVTKTTAFGAFVQLDIGVEGLVHVTELWNEPFARVEDVVSKNDVVTAKVLKLDPENQKIALSIKDYLIEIKGKSGDDIVVS